MSDDEVGIEDYMSAGKLAGVYIKMRDARAKLKSSYEEQDKAIEEQMSTIETQLLDVCKRAEADSIKTQAGTIMRSVATRYWTNDWDSMYNFIKENDALGLFEKRISQANMRQFIEENPDKFPPGMLVDSKYKIIVRRSKS
jgi:hypothetical protein